MSSFKDIMNDYFMYKKKYSFISFIKLIITSMGFRSLVIYRLQQYNSTFFLDLLRIIIINNIEISKNAKIEPGILIPHAFNIVIGGDSVIGKGSTIQQGVTLGGNFTKIKNNRKYPTLGRNVFIGAGVKILGPIVIGNNVVIGANSVVTKNFQHNLIIAGVPAKVLRKVPIEYLETYKLAGK